MDKAPIFLGYLLEDSLGHKSVYGCVFSFSRHCMIAFQVPSTVLHHQKQWLCLLLSHLRGGRLDSVSKKTTELDGVAIPKGTPVTSTMYVLHSGPSTYWPEPEDFHPER